MQMLKFRPDFTCISCTIKGMCVPHVPTHIGRVVRMVDLLLEWYMRTGCSSVVRRVRSIVACHCRCWILNVGVDVGAAQDGGVNHLPSICQWIPTSTTLASRADSRAPG